MLLPSKPPRLILLFLTLVVVISLGIGFFWLSKKQRSAARPESASPVLTSGSTGSTATAASDTQGKSSADSSAQASGPQAGAPAQQSPNPAVLPQQNRGPGHFIAPASLSNPANRNPRGSTREQAANGISIASLLAGVEMTDLQARAKVIEEIRVLEERQNLAVTEKARQLGIQTRIEGPENQVSVLHDFRGDEPLYRRTFNRNAAISTGANLLYPFPYSLDGTGVKVGVWDSGSVRSTHQEFGSRVTLRNPSAAISNHGTHVAGTVGAAGVVAIAKGMAPQVRIDSYDWFNDGSEMTAAGALSAGDVSRIPLSNHSYGYFASTSDMGRYESEARDLDAIAASLPFYLPFWAAGNEQDELTTLGGFQSITFNGLAKNTVTIGAVNDAVAGSIRSPSAGTIAVFSSLGPCDDGRIKPDLVANGVSVYSTIGTSNTAYDGSYSGTSMATPNAMGSAALIVQLYAREFSGKRMPASTLKSLLIHTADDLGNVGPDYTYGWGLVNVKAAGDLVIAHKNSLSLPKIIEGQVTNANKIRTHTLVWDGVSPIRATLAWTDPAGTAQSSPDSRTPNLRHNLDAKITAPDGTTTYQPFVMPFVGTWTQVSMSALATRGKNNVDNLEQVYLATPSQTGTYTVTISVDGTLNPATQNYSLILTGGQSSLSNPPPNVSLTSPADGAAYLPGASVVLAADALDFAVGGVPGAVSQVEFFNGETSVGVDTSAPYSLNWTPPASGTFMIRAKATDSEGEPSTSIIATINVVVGNGVPAISAFNPSSNLDTSRVTLTGSNFVNVSQLKFSGVDASFIVDSPTQISTIVPSNSSTGLITVTNAYGTGTSANSFTVLLPPVLISQVFCASGSTGINPRQDYVELYNRSSSTVSLAGWSVQYAAALSTTWQVANLSGTIAPGKFYLVGLVSSATGLPIPTPNATAPSINLNPIGGKIALIKTSAALSGSSPLETSGLQDFLGFGSANAFEGAVALAPENLSLYRINASNTDTGNNAADFFLASPTARNSSSALTPIISSSLNVSTRVNSPFTYPIIASFGPITYNATALPNGLSINISTGVISGTPTTLGTFPIGISATNSGGTANATLNLSVTPPILGGTVNLFSENIGINGTIILIGSNVFQNLTTSFSGTADTRNNIPSTGYAGASGGRNVYFASGTPSFTISGINTNGYSGLGLSFGHYKAETPSTTQLIVEVSTNGSTYVPLSYTRSPVAAGWVKVTPTGTIPATNNLRIRFRQTHGTYTFRIDDVTVSALLPPIPPPQISLSGTLSMVSSTYGGAAATTTSMTVSGSNLTEFVLISPPAGFEVSQSVASGYAPFLQLGGVAVLPSTPIYLRLAADTPAGFHSGNVLFSTLGGTTVNGAMPSSQVARKLLTITANDLVKPFGSPLALGPNQTAFTTSGLVGGQTVGSVTLTADTGTLPSDPLGVHTITPSSATGGSFNSDNYLFNYIIGILNVVPPSYADWLVGFEIGNPDFNEDSDNDGIANGIENYLGTSPLVSTPALTAVSSNGQSITFRHSRSNLAAVNLISSYQWSADLTTWLASGQQAGEATVTLATSLVSNTDAPANDLIEVTATVTGGTLEKLYLRLRVTQP